MNATRKRMILALLIIGGLVAPASAQDWSKIQVNTIPLTDNVYVLANAGGNIGLSVGADGALLVDAGYAEMAEKVTAAVAAVSKQPIRLIINTHWHFDHVGGNEALAGAGATIIAHENVRRCMSEDRYIAVIDRHRKASPPAARPDITFSESLTLHWNGDEVRVLHVAPGHTDGDSIVHFRQANVLHVGDNWFNGMYPFFDVNAGGSLDGLVKVLDRALELANEQTRIIPGHGPVASAAELRPYRDMLATIRDRIRALIAQGKSREAVIAARPTKEFDEKWGGSWLGPDTWVGLVYDGMSGP